MEKQLDIHVNYQDNHWLNIAETAAVVGSVGGTIASIFLKETIFATLPLSACVALNLINRKRILSLVSTNNNKAIATLSQHNQSDHANICAQMVQIEESVNNNHTKYEIDYKNISDNVNHATSDSKEQIKKLEVQYQELLSKTIKLAQNTNSSSAELYYQNATCYEQTGEKQKAIEEYTKAIQIDCEYPEAYTNRGHIYADIGKKQLAVEDLRKAVKLYFKKGDLENYHLIKQKTQDIYHLDSDSVTKDKNPERDAEQVLANSLFA